MEQQLEYIMMLGFCRDDMGLYLDTHPDDKRAMEYFNQCVDLYEKAKATYEQQFGPLNMDRGVMGDSFIWNQTRQPWEGGA